MADELPVPLQEAPSLLSVLSQLPADVVETNMFGILGPTRLGQLMLLSREAASVLRRIPSSLTLDCGGKWWREGGVDEEVALQRLEEQATRLGLYTSVQRLELWAIRAGQVNHLVVSTAIRRA